MEYGINSKLIRIGQGRCSHLGYTIGKTSRRGPVAQTRRPQNSDRDGRAPKIISLQQCSPSHQDTDARLEELPPIRLSCR